MVPQPTALSLVSNSISGDSRVIKSAQFWSEKGLRSLIVGISTVKCVRPPSIEPVECHIAFHKSRQTAKYGLVDYPTKYDALAFTLGSAAASLAIESPPALIHSHDMLGLVAGHYVMTALRKAGQTAFWIHDVHEDVRGIEVALSERRFLEISEDSYIREPNVLTTVSAALAQRLTLRHALEQSPLVVHSSPRWKDQKGLRQSTLKATIGLNPPEKLMVYVGNVKPQRGLDLMVMALVELPHFHFALLCKTNLYSNYLRTISIFLGVESRLHIMDYVDYKEVSSYISDSDVAVHGLLPSGNAEVAMPNKLWEYLFAGVPLCFSNTSPAANYIEKNGVGSTFETGDMGSFINAIRKIETEWAEMKRRISEMPFESLSWEKQTEALFEEVKKKSPAIVPQKEQG